MAATAPPSDNLYVSDLAEDLNDDSLKQIFEQYGTVAQCRYMPAKAPGGTHTAFVRFSSVEEASAIKELLDGFIPQGMSTAVKIAFTRAGGPKGRGKGGAPPSFAAAAPAAPAAGAPPKKLLTISEAFGNASGLAASPKPAATPAPAAALAMGSAPRLSGQKCEMDVICDALDKSGALPGAQSSLPDENQIYVGGLPPCMEDYHLYRMFSPFGPIGTNGCKIIRHPNGTSKLFGFVNYLVAASANVAVETLNGMILPDGQALKVTLKRPSAFAGKGAGLQL